MRLFLIGDRWTGFFLIALGLILGQTTSAAASQLTLTWSDLSTNEDGFKVERKTGTTGTYAQIAQMGPNTTSSIDSTVSAATTYCYRVRAFNSAGNSAYGSEACGIASVSTQSFTLTVTKTGTGTGTVTSTPTGISCGTDCTETYTATTSVSLSATAADGSTFTGWSGGCSGTGTCTGLLNANTTVTATFAATPPPPPPSPTTLGLTGIGNAVDTSDSHYLNGSKVTVGATSVDVNALSVFVGRVDTAPNNQYQVAIYTDQNGAPGTLVASSTAGTLTPNAWNTRPLVAALQANTSYWLMYNTNGRTASDNNMYYNPGSSGQGAYSSNSVPFGNQPTTFGSAKITTAVYSLYVTTVAAAP